ncbi:MAG: nitroreductase [Candidatus Hydrogenedentota bacterium]
MSTTPEIETMSLDEAIYARRSVRGYLDKPVPQEVLNEVFALAQRTPSNCNIQPWKVFVASGEVRDRLREKMIHNVTNGIAPKADVPYPGKFEGEYRKRQVDCAFEMYGEMGIAREDKEGRMRASLRNFELFDAPHVAFIGMESTFGTTVGLDVGMYMQTLMLAMASRGIASCAQGSMRSYPDLVREEFPGNDNIDILVGMSFGYEDAEVLANNTRIDRDPIDASVTFKG